MVSLTSSTDRTFLSTLEYWLGIQPEILVLIRYSHAAGHKSFELFSSPAALFERLRQLPPRTAVTAFRQPQLPLRGIVDDGFIESCLRSIPEGSEFLVMETAPRTYRRVTFFHHEAGETHTELREALEDSRGNPVAVGLYPPWLEDDPDVVASIVPDQDGEVRPGAY
jgi:hypothetical protein